MGSVAEDTRKLAKQAIDNRDGIAHVLIAALTHLGPEHHLTKVIREQEIGAAALTHAAYAVYRDTSPHWIAYDRKRLDAILGA